MAETYKYHPKGERLGLSGRGFKGGFCKILKELLKELLMELLKELSKFNDQKHHEMDLNSMELFKVWLFFTSKFDNITSLVKSTKISFAYCSLNTFKFKGFYNSKSQKGWWRGRAVVQTKIVYEMIMS